MCLRNKIVKILKEFPCQPKLHIDDDAEYDEFRMQTYDPQSSVGRICSRGF